MLFVAARRNGAAGPSAAVICPPLYREPVAVSVTRALDGGVAGGVAGGVDRRAGAGVIARPDTHHRSRDVPGPDAVREALDVRPRTRRPLVIRAARGRAPDHGDQVRLAEDRHRESTL